jgi:N-acetylmuramoyl-L-alanine amidase-like protein
VKPQIEIVTCPQWGARHPKQGITTVGAASRIIFHHTAGHHREIANPANESPEEAKGYAYDIQYQHMVVNGWIDSGHNFLVCRNGLILQGRWLTVSAIEAGHMVRSAHCPGQNDQIGVEHEHLGGEWMTAAQFEASARLQAWIAACYRRPQVLPVDPHRKYFATACPANLVSQIAAVRHRAQQILNGAGV